MAFCTLCPAIRAQTSSTFGIIVEGKLMVGLLDKSPQVLERSDIAKLPHTTVKVKASGAERQYANLGAIVVVEPVDWPSALFAMADFDSVLTDKRILLADNKDGKPLTAPEGPFPIIVPDEKAPNRWVNQVSAIYIAQIFGPSKGR